MKVTIELTNEELVRAVRVRATQSGRQIRDIVEEALEIWLSARENEEDVTTSADALAEYDKVGGVDADLYFRRMVAEVRIAQAALEATFGSPPDFEVPKREEWGDR